MMCPERIVDEHDAVSAIATPADSPMTLRSSDRSRPSAAPAAAIHLRKLRRPGPSRFFRRSITIGRSPSLAGMGGAEDRSDGERLALVEARARGHEVVADGDVLVGRGLAHDAAQRVAIAG